jgi:hypothetical protein
MPSFNTAEARTIMLEIVNPDIAKLFDQSKSLWNLIEQAETMQTNVRGARLVASVRPNAGMRWKAESDPMAVGGTSRRIEMNVGFKDFSMSGVITGHAIDQTNSNTIAKGLSTRIQEDIETALAEFNQTCYEDGSGVKGVVDTGVGAITTGAGGSVYLSAPFGARRILNEGRYQFYPSGSTTPRSATVSIANTNGVDVAASKVTFDQVPAGTVNGDYVTFQGSKDLAISGLAKHVNNDTGAYQSTTITRANYPELKAVVSDAGGAALSVSAMDALEHSTMYKVNGGTDRSTNDFTMISSPAQRQAYLNLGYELRRFEGADAKLDLGYKVVGFKGHPWVIDTACPDDKIYFLRRSSFIKFEVRKLGIIDEDGKTLHLRPAFDSAGVGSHIEEYIYYLGMRGEIGCKEPNANALLKNLSVTGLPHGRF